jgi:Trk-type K+ transport system membrane component
MHILTPRYFCLGDLSLLLLCCCSLPFPTQDLHAHCLREQLPPNLLSSPSVLLLSAIPNARFARTLLAWAVASEPRLPSDPARDRRTIRFLGSVPVRACSLPSTTTSSSTWTTTSSKTMSTWTTTSRRPFVGLHCINSSLQQLCTATSNKVHPQLACLIQGITAHRLTPLTVPPLGTY